MGEDSKWGLVMSDWHGNIYAPLHDAEKIEKLGVKVRWCTKDKRFERCSVPQESIRKLSEAGYRYELKSKGQTLTNDDGIPIT